MSKAKLAPVYGGRTIPQHVDAAKSKLDMWVQLHNLGADSKMLEKAYVEAMDTIRSLRARIHGGR